MVKSTRLAGPTQVPPENEKERKVVFTFFLFFYTSPRCQCEVNHFSRKHDRVGKEDFVSCVLGVRMRCREADKFFIFIYLFNLFFFPRERCYAPLRFVRYLDERGTRVF